MHWDQKGSNPHTIQFNSNQLNSIQKAIFKNKVFIKVLRLICQVDYPKGDNWQFTAYWIIIYTEISLRLEQQSALWQICVSDTRFTPQSDLTFLFCVQFRCCFHGSLLNSLQLKQLWLHCWSLQWWFPIFWRTFGMSRVTWVRHYWFHSSYLCSKLCSAIILFFYQKLKFTFCIPFHQAHLIQICQNISLVRNAVIQCLTPWPSFNNSQSFRLSQNIILTVTMNVSPLFHLL